MTKMNEICNRIWNYEYMSREIKDFVKTFSNSKQVFEQKHIFRGVQLFLIQQILYQHSMLLVQITNI